MSKVATYKPINIQSLPEISFAYQRNDDPRFPPLSIDESPHAGLDSAERTHYFADTEDGRKSFVTAVIGLASMDRPFRFSGSNETCDRSRIDIENDNFTKIKNAGEAGCYAIAATCQIVWDTTPDDVALAEIDKWALEHFDQLANLGTVTVQNSSEFITLTANQFAIA